MEEMVTLEMLYAHNGIEVLAHRKHEQESKTLEELMRKERKKDTKRPSLDTEPPAPDPWELSQIDEEVD